MSRRLWLFGPVVLLAAACVASASASGSASAYRQRVNSICRSYTPALKKVKADVAAAKQSGDAHRLAYDLGYSIALGLREDAAIEAVPVPAELRATMAPILRLFKTVDAHARAFLRYAAAGDVTAALGEISKIAKLARPMNGMLDRAGLRDCGSNQG